MKKPSRLFNPTFQALLLGCLTLGLAPFLPEPHLIGKLRWVWGGAVGMRLLDWGDLLLHGMPWMALLAYVSWYYSGTKK